MSVTTKVLVPAKEMEAVQTTQYTATNCTAILDKFTVTNTTAGNLTFSVNLVTSGGSPAASNTIYDDRPIASGETFGCPGLVGQVLANGGFISTIASAAGLTLRVSGREIT
jgi:hypothetical protein